MPDVRDRSPRSIREILSRLIQSAGLAERMAEQRLLAKWPKAVGPEIARRTHARKLADRVLYVTVDSAPWAQELSFMKPLILEALGRVGEKNAVRDVRLSVGVLPNPDPIGAEDDLPPVHAEGSAERVRALSQGLDGVSDPALREKLTGLIVKHVCTSPPR